MIDVQVSPLIIPLDQPVDVNLQFTNREDGICTQLYFQLERLVSISFIQGGGPIIVPVLDIGIPYIHILKLQAQALGQFELKSRHFSYYDWMGRHQKAPACALTFQVVHYAEPILQLVFTPVTTQVGTCSQVEGIITNEGFSPACNVQLHIAGLEVNPSNISLGNIPTGTTIPFTFQVCPEKAGIVLLKGNVRFYTESGRLLQLSNSYKLPVEALPVSHTTIIQGPINGPVHSGSGEIKIHNP